jgi:hypothetical protein
LRLNHAGIGPIVDACCTLQAKVDADDIGGLHDRLRQHDVAFTLDRERDEPAIGAAADRRREDAAGEAALATGLLQAHPADIRQPQVPLFERHPVQPCRVALCDAGLSDGAEPKRRRLRS